MLDVHLLSYALSGCCACPSLIDHQLRASPLQCCLCCIGLFDGLFPGLASCSCQGVSPRECRCCSGTVQVRWWWCSRWFPPAVKAGAGSLCSQWSSALHRVVKSLWSSPFWSCTGLIPALFFFFFPLVLVYSVPLFCLYELFSTFISHKHPP